MGDVEEKGKEEINMYHEVDMCPDSESEIGRRSFFFEG